MSGQLQDVIAGLDVDRQLEYLDGKGLFSLWHLYQLGVQLINSGLAYQVSEFEWDQDDCRFEFSPLAEADEAMKGLLLERYNNLPKYRVNNGSRTYYENAMHGLFILKVALDHLDTSVILAMYRFAKAQSSGKTISKYDLGSPNGSHYGDINILDKMIAFYIESNQDCFDQNIELEQLDHYFLAGQGYHERINKIKPLMQRGEPVLQPNEPI